MYWMWACRYIHPETPTQSPSISVAGEIDVDHHQIVGAPLLLTAKGGHQRHARGAPARLIYAYPSKLHPCIARAYRKRMGFAGRLGSQAKDNGTIVLKSPIEMQGPIRPQNVRGSVPMVQVIESATTASPCVCTASEDNLDGISQWNRLAMTYISIARKVAQRRHVQSR
eukprot:COSAG05_NODE_3378_length_2100_cov_3.102319_4_plen_169_part_00